MKEEKRGRGRPKKDDPRCETVNIRFTRDEMETLEKLAEFSGDSKQGILRRALMFYNEATKGL